MAADLAGKCALVTGASSGLGVDFARELAARGARLVIVARRDELLKLVQEEIKNRYGVEVMTVALDLGAPSAPQELYDLLRQQNVQVDVLVNNAGFGLFGMELDIPWERTRDMLQLDIVALTHLTKLFARDMVKRGSGWLLQVASIGAYQPSPTYAAYSAAKSYVLSFSDALNLELRGTGVSCTALSPGYTETAFLEVSGQKPTLFHQLTAMKPAEVARIGVQRMLDRGYSVVPGWINKLLAFSTRLTPRPLLAWLTWRLMRNPS
ncbi:MAG TPA: SDR family oxidoreductase [Nevskiaceae bacterium]|nr:SDR family oxidoreductase [Nevskiaceae bacterium]